MTGRFGLLCGLFVYLGSWQGIAQDPSPAAHLAPTDGGSGQEHSQVKHHKKLLGVGHSPWVFYKKVVIDFIAE